MSVIENWSRIEGRVQEVRHDPELPEHVVAAVAVERAEAVDDPAGGAYPNLFREKVGEMVDVHVPIGLATANQLAAGRQLTGRAKRTSPTRAFVTELDVS